MVRINYTKLKSKKVLIAEVVNENGFIPVSLLFSFLRKVLSLFRGIPFEAKQAQKATYRLISPNSFFAEGFLDVSFEQKPVINQEFRIKGIEGKWLLIRRNTFAELYKEILQKENKLNEGKIRSTDRLLEEEYPYLYLEKGRDEGEMEILEVLELA